MPDLIKAQSVALRLEAGSEEAGYLAQIFPLPQTPTVVIIKNGELKEYIVAGASKEDFLRRIRAAFSAQPQASQSAAQESTSPQAQASQPQLEEQAPQQTGTSENVRRILAERAARLQAQREEAERKTKEERAKAKEKAKADADAGADTEAARAHKQAELVRKKKKKDEEERQRILKRIADDKAERRERAIERQKAKEEDEKKASETATSAAPSTKLPSSTRVSDMTALQVRLFDGSTIRSRFKTDAPLKDVRKWVDETRHDGNLPYTFKQVLTPLPNKNIDSTEESKVLGDLGLAPSSTLVLIPVRTYAGAYDESSGNLLMRSLRLILGFFTWVFGSLGFAGTRALDRVRNPEEEQTPARAAAQGRSRVQGFQNPDDRRRDQQLYNGNSVSRYATTITFASNS